MFIVGKSFFSETLSELNIKTIAQDQGGDWVTTVHSDLEHLGINLTLENIKLMKK